MNLINSLALVANALFINDLKFYKMNLSKLEKVIGIILAVLLLVVTLSSTFFFLGTLKVSVFDWLAFNACAPTSFLYLCFFIVFLINKQAGFLVATSLPTYFLGTMSMFVLPWNDSYLVAHVGHIIMTLNLLWVFYVVLKHKSYKALAIGLLVGMLVFVPYIAYVQTYNQTHAEEISKLFQQK